MKTYDAIESGGPVPSNRKVIVSVDGVPVATFYAYAFANGHWNGFVEGVTRAGDRLRMTTMAGHVSYIAGSLDDMVGPW